MTFFLTNDNYCFWDLSQSGSRCVVVVVVVSQILMNTYKQGKVAVATAAAVTGAGLMNVSLGLIRTQIK